MSGVVFTQEMSAGLTVQANAYAPIARIAERLGVRPLEGRDRRPRLIVSGADYLPLNGSHVAPTYDVFEVVEALLDRLDVASSK